MYFQDWWSGHRRIPGHFWRATLYEAVSFRFCERLYLKIMVEEDTQCWHLASTHRHIHTHMHLYTQMHKSKLVHLEASTKREIKCTMFELSREWSVNQAALRSICGQLREAKYTRGLLGYNLVFAPFEYGPVSCDWQKVSCCDWPTFSYLNTLLFYEFKVKGMLRVNLF